MGHAERRQVAAVAELETHSLQTVGEQESIVRAGDRCLHGYPRAGSGADLKAPPIREGSVRARGDQRQTIQVAQIGATGEPDSVSRSIAKRDRAEVARGDRHAARACVHEEISREEAAHD